MISRMLHLALFAIVVASTAIPMVAGAAPLNAVQKKYWEGKDGCTPKGKLKEFLTTCGDTLDRYDLMECKVAVDAMTGKLDAGFAELFVDMIAMDPKSPELKFLNICDPDVVPPGPAGLEGFALQGLAYTHDAKYAPLITAMVDPSHLAKIKKGTRFAVTDALAYMGDKSVAEAPYKALLGVESMDPQYKTTILWMLGNWKSDAGVEFCSASFAKEPNDEVRKACILYLGQRKAKDTIPAMQRMFDGNEAVVLHAYGQMGDKSVLKDIDAYLAKTAGGFASDRMPALVAAVNLGEAKHLPEILTFVSGKKPPGKGEKLSKDVDDKTVQVAAMESLLLTDAKAIAAVKKALAPMAAKKVDKAWRAYVYPTIALAQWGDAKAATALAGLIGSPNKEVRMAVLDALGANEMHPDDYWKDTGFGFVASKDVAAALVKDIPMETEKAGQLKATHALGITEAMLVSAK